MVQAPIRWTAEMVRALPLDHKRYEVIGGDLIVNPGPSWTHQTAVELLLTSLFEYLHNNGAGHVKTGPAEIEFDVDTLVQPDIFVVPRRAEKAPRSWEEVGELLLVIEVLSPSSARTDRLRKRELYLSRGAPEYWVVDTDARLIERWRSGDDRPEIIAEEMRWHPTGAASPFMLNVAEYFEEVLDR